MIVDLGTGDGRAVLAIAAREPGSLVLGIDANAASMAESSRRAARSPLKGGLPNAIFVVSSAESLPEEIAGSADEVSVTFPWGSLLRGVLGLDGAVAASLSRMAKPGAPITALVSVTERDGILEVGRLDEAAVAELGRRLSTYGLDLVEARPATIEDLAAAHSSWARRLRSDTSRPVWRLVLRQDGGACPR